MNNHAKTFASNASYRSFMTNNANSIMKDNQTFAQDNIRRTAIGIKSDDNQTHPPYAFSSALDRTAPRGYESNGTKERFLNDYRQESRIISVDVPIGMHEIQNSL